MAALELRIISELLRSKDMLSVIELGFNDSHLVGDPEAAQIFAFIRKWYFSNETYRQFPSPQAIKRRWPTFVKTTNKEDQGQLRSLMKECMTESVSNDVRSLVDWFSELVDEDPVRAVELMQSKLARIQYQNRPATGFSLQEIADQVEHHYQGALDGTIYGIPWPWEELTKDTLGKNPGDFIVLYGRMKSMKTWLLLKSALDDFLVHRRRVLIWSREMSKQKMALRSGAILGGVDYQMLKNGTLPRPLYQQTVDALRQMSTYLEGSKEALASIEGGTYQRKDVPDLLIVCGRGTPIQLEALEPIVEAFGPDIVYLDSVYHMETAGMAKMRNDADRQRELAISVKQRALDWSVPIVATTQANREGENTHGDTLADIGRTDAFGQEGDLILRVLNKDGRAPSEDEYEGYWDRLRKKTDGAKEKRRSSRAPKMGKIARNKFARKLPTKIASKLADRIPERPRTSADVYLMVGGNREGVLQGVQLHAIPGYKFDFVQSVTYDEVREIFGKKKKKKGGTEGGGSKKDEWQAINPAKVGVGYKA